ncbi:MAG: hypothetical protein A2096_02255 [Spirochaetes bacterium GWF1_41_5]|nr:MAG: hypothetical protein A2096_02255 [Spirochaetes bacterium GWF1_41_5]HBE04388.1 hypothetical protein [Spirochaetia bacterium]
MAYYAQQLVTIPFQSGNHFIFFGVFYNLLVFFDHIIIFKEFLSRVQSQPIDPFTFSAMLGKYLLG